MGGEQGDAEYLGLVPFLVEMFSRSKDIVLTYNVSQGVQFPDKKMRKRCLVAVNARRAIEGEVPIDAFPNSPAHVLPMLERLITDRSQRVAVVLDFFETVVPMSDLSYMGEGDKANLSPCSAGPPIQGSWERQPRCAHHRAPLGRTQARGRQRNSPHSESHSPSRMNAPPSSRACDHAGVEAEMDDAVL